MKFINRSGKVVRLPCVVDTVICCTGPLSELKDIIPQRLQVLLVVTPFWEVLLSEESQLP